MSEGSESKFSGFADLLRRGLGDLLAPEATDFVSMMAEDGVMEFPYAPPDGVRALSGRTELVSYLERLGGLLELTSYRDLRVYRTTDPGVVVLEFTAQGRGVQSGLPYEGPYISVITVRDGHIRHYRDYWNPLAATRALGGLGALAGASR